MDNSLEKPKTTEIWGKYALTETDRQEYMEKIGQVIEEQVRLEVKIKDLTDRTKDYKKDYEAKFAEIRRMSDAIRTGEEERYIKCVIRYRFEAEEKDYIEIKSGELIRTERMTEEELQMFVDFRDKTPTPGDPLEVKALPAPAADDKEAEADEDIGAHEPDMCESLHEFIRSNTSFVKKTTQAGVALLYLNREERTVYKVLRKDGQLSFESNTFGTIKGANESIDLLLDDERAIVITEGTFTANFYLSQQMRSRLISMGFKLFRKGQSHPLASSGADVAYTIRYIGKIGGKLAENWSLYSKHDTEQERDEHLENLLADQLSLLDL